MRGLCLPATLSALAFFGQAYGSDLSASLSLTSDYRIRGVSQDNRLITPEAELDWNDDGGWSLDARAFKVDFKDHARTSTELDFVVGKKLDLNGTSLLVQTTYYAYPDHARRGGAPRYSLFEATATVTRTWGPWTPSVFVAWSPNYFGETGSAEYTAVGLGYQVNGWLSASADAGEQWIARFNGVHGSGFPYANWDFGFTATRGALAFDLRYAATNLSQQQCLTTQGGRNWCKAGVFATVSYTIGVGH